MKKSPSALGALALFLVLALPAQANDSGWHLRVVAAGFDPSLDETVMNDDGDDVHISAGTDLGFGASLEYQINRRFGIEGGLLYGSTPVDLSSEIPGYGTLELSESMSTREILLEVDFHLTPDSPYFDFYLSGGIAMLSYGDLSYEVPELDEVLDLRILDSTGWTARAGVDISFGANSSWAATGGVRYTDGRLKINDREDSSNDFVTFDFGLVHFTVGIAFSF